MTSTSAADETQSTLAQIRSVIGDMATAFLLDLSLESLDAAGLDHARCAVCDELGPLLRQLISGQVNVADTSRLAQIFTSIPPGATETLLEVTRKRIDGWLPTSTGDNLTDSLARLVFNGLMIESLPNGRTDRFLISASFQDPRMYGPLARAFLEDPDLARLFPQIEDGGDTGGAPLARSILWWIPTGFGGGMVDLRIASGAIVSQILARLRFASSLDQRAIQEAVTDALDELRALSRGETVSVVVMVGLYDVEVAVPFDGGEWGVVPAYSVAIEFAGEEELPIRSVVWMRAPSRIISRHRADISEEGVSQSWRQGSKEMQESMDAIQESIDVVKLSILASTTGEDVRASVSSSQPWNLFLLSSMNFAFPPLHASPRPDPLRLEADEVSAMSQIVQELQPFEKGLSIALRRILRPASEQRDPADALIDAVIAWENMVGGNTETTLRVCAGIAKLIEPVDEQARRVVYAQCKKIYVARSNLVHGSVGPERVGAFSEDALRIAIEALRAVHRDPIMRAAKDSTERSTLLLLR